MSENKKVKVTLKKSLIGVPESLKKVVASLGLSKTNQTKEHFDTPIIRGMINKVTHLVVVE